MLRLVEELMDGSLAGQQKVGQGLAWRAVFQQHGGYQGLGNGLVRHSSAPEQRAAVQQNRRPAREKTSVTLDQFFYDFKFKRSNFIHKDSLGNLAGST